MNEKQLILSCFVGPPCAESPLGGQSSDSYKLCNVRVGGGKTIYTQDQNMQRSSPRFPALSVAHDVRMLALDFPLIIDEIVILYTIFYLKDKSYLGIAIRLYIFNTLVIRSARIQDYSRTSALP